MMQTPNSTDYVYQAKTLFRMLDEHTTGIGLAIGMMHHPSIQVGPNQHGNQYAFIPISIPLKNIAKAGMSMAYKLYMLCQMI